MHFSWQSFQSLHCKQSNFPVFPQWSIFPENSVFPSALSSADKFLWASASGWQPPWISEIIGEYLTCAAPPLEYICFKCQIMTGIIFTFFFFPSTVGVITKTLCGKPKQCFIRIIDVSSRFMLISWIPAKAGTVLDARMLHLCLPTPESGYKAVKLARRRF